MTRFQLLLVLVLVAIESGLSVKFPSTFKRCKVGKETDGKPNECLRVAVEDAIFQLTEADNTDLGVLRLDPLNIKNIYLEKGESSPVAIKLNFTDNSLTGISTTKVKAVTGKLSSPGDFDMDVELRFDHTSLVGPYTISGKILILPIQGVGESNITMQGVKITLKIRGSSQTKNNREYLKLQDLVVTIEPDHLYISLGNLFNGDKALGDNMNKFINENWKLIYPELQGPLEDAFSAIFFEYSKRILDRIPFDRIFLTS